MAFAFLAVEGIVDLELAGRILAQSGFQRYRKLEDLPDFWRRIVPDKYPPKGELDKRVRVPSFFRRDPDSVAISWVGSQLDAFGKHFRESFATLDQAELTAIGILADADQNAAEDMAARIARVNQVTGLEFPAESGRVTAGRPRLGTFFSPGIGKGTVEDLLLDCAAVEFPGLLQLAGQFVSGAEALIPVHPEELASLGHHSGPQRASVGAIASLLKPGKSVQASIQDHRWISDRTLALPRVALLAKFLNDLLAFR